MYLLTCLLRYLLIYLCINSLINELVLAGAVCSPVHQRAPEASPPPTGTSSTVVPLDRSSTRRCLWFHDVMEDRRMDGGGRGAVIRS